MATLLQKMAKSAEAEPLYRQALNICSRAQVKDTQVCVCVWGGGGKRSMYAAGRRSRPPRWGVYVCVGGQALNVCSRAQVKDTQVECVWGGGQIMDSQTGGGG